MPRTAWVLIVVVLFGVHASVSLSLFHAWLAQQPLESTCADYLEDGPQPGWVKLKECELRTLDALLESETGEFETLDNRRKGLATKLFDTPPVWVAVWLPVTAGLKKGPTRAMLRNDSKDLLKWVNQLENASPPGRDELWADPVLLRRMSKPGLIEGHAEKPEADVLRRAFGAGGSVNLYLISPGQPEPGVHPSVAIVAGLIGIVVIAAFLSKFVKKSEDAELTPEQVTARNIVGKTRVELGELEQLRAEERARRDQDS